MEKEASRRGLTVRTLPEIIHLFQTQNNQQSVKASNNHGDAEEQSMYGKACFLWVAQFTSLCKETISDPTVANLDKLISTFLRHVETDAKQCYKKPKRAYKLRLRMNSFLNVIRMIYSEIKKPLEHTGYLDRMSEVLSLYVDMVLKSTRRGKEHPKKIAEHICASLFLFLDKSMDHILDSVLKSKYFIKRYNDICAPVMMRLLKENPDKMDEVSYVRYLLSFKLWKRLVTKDQYRSINKEAVAKLKPPLNFHETLKSGMFANVLPSLPRSEKNRMTLFYMQCPFNIKKKAQLFFKNRQNLAPDLLDDSVLIDEDYCTFSTFCGDSFRENEACSLQNEIWHGIVDGQLDPLDVLFDSDSYDDDVIDLTETCTDSSNKSYIENIDSSNNNNHDDVLIKPSAAKVTKKRKLTKPKCGTMENCKESIKTENVKSLLVKEESMQVSSGDETVKMAVKSTVALCDSPEFPIKPFATIESEQSKQVEPDSLSKNDGSSSPKPSQRPAINSVDTINKGRITILDSSVSKTDEQPNFDHLVVGQEIEIGQEDSNSSIVFIDSQEKLDIMNVIGVSNDVTTSSTDMALKDMNTVKTTENPENKSPTFNQTKENVYEEQVPVIQESSQILQFQNNEEAPLSQRQNCYSYNEIILRGLLPSEINGDDGSDEDLGYPPRSQYAGGGKLCAFKKQLEESRSDCSDSETPSPASRSDYHIVESSTEIINTPLASMDNNTQDSKDSGIKSPFLGSEKEEVIIHPAANEKSKPVNCDPSKLPEVSVTLSQTEFTHMSEYYGCQERSPYKGKCGSIQQTSKQSTSSHSAVQRVEDTPVSDDDVPLLSLEEKRVETESKEPQQKRSRSSRKKPAETPPSPETKSSPPKTTQKRRSRRRRHY